MSKMKNEITKQATKTVHAAPEQEARYVLTVKPAEGGYTFGMGHPQNTDRIVTAEQLQNYIAQHGLNNIVAVHELGALIDTTVKLVKI